MSIYKGSKLVAGGSTNTVSDIIKLFKHDWYDYSFSDLSWVRADDFEWIYADRYPIAYEHLYTDFISTSTWQSETIGSYTIQFKIAPDGHRITDHANEGIVQNIYGQSGVAWYYIIDTVNERFKLPRENSAREELIQTVPIQFKSTKDNNTVDTQIHTGVNTDYGLTSALYSSAAQGSYSSITASADLSLANDVYKGKKCLYFYLGQFPVSALVNPDIAETKANTSMDNLNSVGRNISNWSSNVTNCITEIPQDIKLKLNNGVLTLKAGSKVYVPSEAGMFNVVTTTSDLTWTGGWGSLQFFVYLSPYNTLVIREVLLTESGANSALTTQYRSWYDTTNNKVKWTDDTGATWIDGYSFPIALVTSDASSIISIDQVFNGFGYIGSTAFILPGVKGLIPNDRNEDRTLKSIEFKVTAVKTSKNTGSGRDWFVYDSLGNFNRVPSTAYKFDIDKNKFMTIAEGADRFFCVCGTTTGDITSFTPKTIFRAIDYNDKSIISDWCVPDYSAGISKSFDTQYTAEYSGVLFVVDGHTSGQPTITINGNTFYTGLLSAGAFCSCSFFIRIKKNDVYKYTSASSSGITGRSLTFYPFKGA